MSGRTQRFKAAAFIGAFTVLGVSSAGGQSFVGESSGSGDTIISSATVNVPNSTTPAITCLSG
jgi:hypothetical protein